MAAGAEIVCSACGAEALVVRQPVYEGFKKVGEEFLCSACGHVYSSEADVPFKSGGPTPILFTETDRSPTPHLFDAAENEQLCRYCANYVINPFTQWCSLHRREVEATDSCDQFTRRENTDDAAPDRDEPE